MTTLTVRSVAPATPFERVLLSASVRLDRFVVDRRARRAWGAGADAARGTAAEERARAQAIGALGILPR